MSTPAGTILTASRDRRSIREPALRKAGSTVRDAVGSKAAIRTSTVAQRQAAIRQLIPLVHRRWSIPVLAEFHALGGVTGRPAYVGGGGAKFVTLIARLSLSRDSLNATLDHLIKHDYLMRNPGYGHPMRPEYLLADAGHSIVGSCWRLMRLLRLSKREDVALKKWSLPVMFLLHCGLDRFGTLKAGLSGITSRALTLTLKELMSAGLLTREVTQDYPPGTRYRLTRDGKRVAVLVQAVVSECA